MSFAHARQSCAHTSCVNCCNSRFLVDHFAIVRIADAAPASWVPTHDRRTQYARRLRAASPSHTRTRRVLSPKHTRPCCAQAAVTRRTRFVARVAFLSMIQQRASCCTSASSSATQLLATTTSSIKFLHLTRGANNPLSMS